MSEYYDRIGSITEVTESYGSPITVPEAGIEGTPYRVQNCELDDIAFVSGATCVRDKATGALLLNTRDFVVAKPTTEYELRHNPAVMRTMYTVGETVAKAAFIVDYRHIGFPRCEDIGSGDSLDTESFRSYQEKRGTIFPTAALFNERGTVRFVGPQGLLRSAKYMMNLVDSSLTKASLAPYVHAIRPQIQEVDYAKVVKPAQAEPAGPEIVRFEAKKVPTDVPNVGHQLLGFAVSLAGLELLKAVDLRRA